VEKGGKGGRGRNGEEEKWGSCVFPPFFGKKIISFLLWEKNLCFFLVGKKLEFHTFHSLYFYYLFPIFSPLHLSPSLPFFHNQRMKAFESANGEKRSLAEEVKVWKERCGAMQLELDNVRKDLKDIQIRGQMKERIVYVDRPSGGMGGEGVIMQSSLSSTSPIRAAATAVIGESRILLPGIEPTNNNNNINNINNSINNLMNNMNNNGVIITDSAPTFLPAVGSPPPPPPARRR
jgi:hypothetical protein